MGGEDPEEIQFRKQNVSIRRTVTTERFEQIAVAFQIQSERSNPTQIRLFEDIPPAIGVENVGFHPNYHGEHWSIEGNQVMFDRWFQPGEELITIYGVVNIDPDQGQRLLTEPSLDVVAVSEEDTASTQQEAETESQTETRTEDSKDTSSELQNEEFLTELGKKIQQVTPEQTTAASNQPPNNDGASAESHPSVSETRSESTSAPMQEQSQAESPDADVTKVESHENHSEVSDSDPTTDSAGRESNEDESSSADGQLTAMLAQELRDDHVAPEDRQILKQTLGSYERHREVRVRHLQQRISDLEAYTDALESFIEENGRGRDLINDLKRSMTELDEELDSLDSRVQSTATDLNTLSEELVEIASEIDSMEDSLDGLSHDVKNIEADVESVQNGVDQLEGLETRTEAIEADMSNINETLDSLDAFRDNLLSILESESDR